MKHSADHFCKRFIGPALALLLAAGCDQSPPPVTTPQPQSLPTVTLPLGNKTFTLQVADDTPKRETGLMYVRSMPADRGMIFLFPHDRVQEFWMHNTHIDLDIVYANSAGKIVAVKTMHAFDETGISSEEPASIAIELNRGVAADAGLAAGGTVAIPPELLAKAR